jgi:hypothetical protein
MSSVKCIWQLLELIITKFKHLYCSCLSSACRYGPTHPHWQGHQIHSYDGKTNTSCWCQSLVITEVVVIRGAPQLKAGSTPHSLNHALHNTGMQQADHHLSYSHSSMFDTVTVSFFNWKSTHRDMTKDRTQTSLRGRSVSFTKNRHVPA